MHVINSYTYSIVHIVTKSGKVHSFLLSLPFYTPYRTCFLGLFNDALNVETIASDGTGIDK
jgi:hypothetical protein